MKEFISQPLKDFKMIYLKMFKISRTMSKNPNIYPHNVFKDKEPDIFVFDRITVLYGNNGCGKSTILNLMAHKLNLLGKERNNPTLEGLPAVTKPPLEVFTDFVSECDVIFGENESGKELTRVPPKSRYLKSEEILYEIRKIQQDSVLEESYICNHVRNGMNTEQAKKFRKSSEGGKQLEFFRFAQEKYSNGETTLQLLDDLLEPDNLYLLDEPEVSLSPQNQVMLADKLNEMARFLNNQFIIATHSPFMLGTLNAKIYNLDTKYYKVQKWSELDNIKYFYHFFESRKGEFED